MQNYAKTQYFLVKKYNDLKNKTKFSTTNASFFVIVTLDFLHFAHKPKGVL